MPGFFCAKFPITPAKSRPNDNLTNNIAFLPYFRCTHVGLMWFMALISVIKLACNHTDTGEQDADKNNKKTCTAVPFGETF